MNFSSYRLTWQGQPDLAETEALCLSLAQATVRVSGLPPVTYPTLAAHFLAKFLQFCSLPSVHLRPSFGKMNLVATMRTFMSSALSHRRRRRPLQKARITEWLRYRLWSLKGHMVRLQYLLEVTESTARRAAATPFASRSLAVEAAEARAGELRTAPSAAEAWWHSHSPVCTTQLMG